MSKERYFLEAYIPGKDLPDLKTRKSDNPQDESHLHITLARPFNIEKDPESIKDIVINFCKGKKEIPYNLEGKDSFDDKIFFIPVISKELQIFDKELEEILNEKVLFDKKLNEEKIHHLTVDKSVNPVQKKEMLMTQLICIRDKKDGSGKRIWFGFDFNTQEILSREEILSRKNK